VKFSIIIPTANRNELLGICLQQLTYNAQGLTVADYEVIVSDDGKANQAKDFIQQHFPFVQWIEGPKKGPASNRNNGAEHATGEWLIFLDDDCIPSTDIIRQYKQLIEAHPNVQVFEGKILPEGKSTSPIEYAPINTEGGHLWSCNFAISRQAFDAVKGFDENFKYPHMEDVDLRDRLQAAGTPIQFAATAQVTHPWRKMNDGKKLGMYQEMYVYYHAKHQKPLTLSIILNRIARVHLALLRKAMFSKEVFTAMRIMWEHMYTVLIHYNKWKKMYVAKS